MLDGAFAQPLQDWLLCALGLFQQRLAHEATLFGLGRQIGGRAEVRLTYEHDKIQPAVRWLCVHYRPGDLLPGRKNAANCPLTLPARTRRSSGSHKSCGGCDEEQ